MPTINGIDLDILQNDVIDLSRREPELFQKTFTASAIWNTATNITMKAGANELNVNCGCENPVACAADANRSFKPIEVALGALGTCMAVLYAAFGAMKGITIKSLRVDIEGDINVGPLYHLNEDTSVAFTEIRLNVFVDSDATESQLEELEELCKLKSPVFDMVANSIPVNTLIHSTAMAA